MSFGAQGKKTAGLARRVLMGEKLANILHCLYGNQVLHFLADGNLRRLIRWLKDKDPGGEGFSW
jgi:hypothetical protein